MAARGPGSRCGATDGDGSWCIGGGCMRVGHRFVRVCGVCMSACVCGWVRVYAFLVRASMCVCVCVGACVGCMFVRVWCMDDYVCA